MKYNFDNSFIKF